MDESNFVVKTIFHACGSSEVLTENYFATWKEAEEFCVLTDYALCHEAELRRRAAAGDHRDRGALTRPARSAAG